MRLLIDFVLRGAFVHVRMGFELKQQIQYVNQ